MSSRFCQKLTNRIPNPTQIQSCREVQVQLCSLGTSLNIIRLNSRIIMRLISSSGINPIKFFSVPSPYPERNDNLEKEESGNSFVQPENVESVPADIELDGNPSGNPEKVSTSSVYQEKVDRTSSYTEKDGSSPSYLEKVGRSPVNPEKVGSFPVNTEPVGSSPALPESLNSSPGIPEKVDNSPALPESLDSSPGIPEKVGSSPFIPESSSVNPDKVESPPTDPETISPESSPERIAAYIYSEDCKPVLKEVGAIFNSFFCNLA